VTEHLNVVLHEGEGPLALVIHGALGSRSYWNDNLKALQSVCRPAITELWGHGNSPSPSDSRRFEPTGYIEEFERIRQQNSSEKVWLIGQSMGAALALHYASTHPERVSGLVITNSASAFADPMVWQKRNRSMIAKVADQVENEGVESLRDSWINPGRSKRILPGTLACLAREFAEHTQAGIVGSFRITNYSLPLGDLLKTINQPTLLTNGVHEERFQEHLARARLIPNLEIVDLPASHAVNAHDPEGWNAAATKFIRQHETKSV